MHRFLVILAVLICNLTVTTSVEAASTASSTTDKLIWKIARQEMVDPYMLRAMVAVESAFDPRSVSKKGAVGLMQLMPDTARELGVTNRFNPEQNLRGGARYFKQMLRRFSDIRLALAAYNAGPGNVTRFRGIPPFAETRKYVGSVMRNYAKTIPGSNTTPKRIYRFRKPNGTLVLTDTRRVFALATIKGKDQQHRLLKRSPYLSIVHRPTTAQTNRMGPNVPAKLRLKPVVDRPSTTQTPPIIHTRVMSKSTGQTFAVITNKPIVQLASIESLEPIVQANIKSNEIPIIRLSRQ